VPGVGAYLVIQQEATAGSSSRARSWPAALLAPIDLAIANWKGFCGARGKVGGG
jgi:ATP-binding cassette subfamily C protein